MKDSVSSLRSAIRRVQQRKPKRRRYGSDVRAGVVGHALAARSRGVSLRSTAAALGLPYKTLTMWCQARLRGFRLVATPPRSTSAGSDEGYRLVTAQGHRVDGLSRDDLVAVLRALS